MKNVKWIFVVLLFSSLTSFVDSNKPTSGLNVGDMAPDFTIRADSNGQQLSLKNLKGKYVLLSFWASYDAPSRMRNVSLDRMIQVSSQKVEMISVSFDEYESVFNETLRKDRIGAAVCQVETSGEASDLFNTYRLNKGFKNYLLDKNGVILAKNISASELSSYLN